MHLPVSEEPTVVFALSLKELTAAGTVADFHGIPF